MRAAALRHRVTLEEPVRVDDTAGGWLEEWRAVASRIPARVEPLAGNELYRAMQVSASLAYEIELRHRSGIHAGMRAVWHRPEGDRVLEIIAPPREDPRRRSLRLSAEVRG